LTRSRLSGTIALVFFLGAANVTDQEFEILATTVIVPLGDCFAIFVMVSLTLSFLLELFA